MSDRAAQLRTLATSFYREMMRLADEMDGERGLRCICPTTWTGTHATPRPINHACPQHGVRPMDPALDS